MASYLTVAENAPILLLRVGDDAALQTAAHGERIRIGDTAVSFHPAGHIRGSSQVRIESGGQVWVVSGDYKLAADPTCKPFDPVRCHGFVTEATFALPIYRWRLADQIFNDMNDWWRQNSSDGKASILYCYALGKAQRVLAGIDASLGPIFTHGAVESLTQLYRAQGVNLPPTQHAIAASKRDFAGSLILAPPSASGSPWIRRFGEFSRALASGWMQIRGTRRRKAVDRGFALSDHADWPGLLSAIRATSAETIWVTHGQSEPLARLLAEQGLDAHVVQTEFEGEVEEQPSSIEDEAVSE
jgi:putative mRNA 3-end processing factor